MSSGSGTVGDVGARDWIRAALAMFAVGWGANQFAPLLSVYQTELGLGQGEVTGMFAVYIVGLIPALVLAGRWSDAHGRRVLMRPVLVLSLAATVIMLLGPADPVWLYLGRFLAGVASGAAFGPGGAWIKELSAGAAPGAGARRAAVAVSGGFGLSALVAGIVGQFLPAPVFTPYGPHLVLGAVAVVVGWNAPDPYRPRPDAARASLLPPSARTRRFVLGVAPWAALVFGCASMSFVVLAGLVGGDAAGMPVAYAGVLAGITLGTGVLVQSGARRLASAAAPWRVPVAGLVAAALGMAAGAGLVAAEDLPLRALVMLPVAVLLGAGYGTLLVGGLVEVELQAGPADHAGLVAVFYALAYMGMATPYAIAEVSRLGGPVPWILGIAAACLALVPLTVSQLRDPRTGTSRLPGVA